MKFSMFVLIVLLGLVAAFAVQNPVDVTVRFFSLSGTTHLLVVIVASFAAGVLGVWLASIPGYFRRRSELSEAHRRVQQLESEVEALKAKTAPPAAP